MKGKIRLLSFILLFFCLTFTACGCVFIIGGSVGAACGYAVSSDTIEGMVDKSYENIWDASAKVTNILGNVKFKDSKKGYIEAEVGQTKVNINIEKITDETTRVRIKARRYYKLMPDIALAQKIYTKIMQETK